MPFPPDINTRVCRPPMVSESLCMGKGGWATIAFHPLEAMRALVSFAETVLANARPDAVRSVKLPRRTHGYPSPVDWRDEVLYFLLPDRFSNGVESGPPLDPAQRGRSRPGDF